MSIQIFPYKLTQGALEARLATGETVLPGQLLRFDELPFVFGEVSEVQALPDIVAGLPEGHNVKITLLRGTPSLKPTAVTPLSAQEMVKEVVQLLPTPEYPVDLGTFRSDYLRLGPFTLVEGPNFLLKYQALLAMMEAVRPYQKMLILDPVGVFESVGDIACYQAGETVRLSLQEVSIRRFLDAFGSLFPEGIRKPVTEAVASHWPASGSFSGFSPLLVSGMITESLLKNIILQNCAHVIRNKLFAEAPAQVLDLKALAQNRVSVLDLSLLQEPWKSFFYQEVMAQVFAAPELGLTPILIYPENYLPDLPDWIQQADETERHMLAVASNYGSATVRQWASNLVSVRASRLPVIRGELTLGLPVAFGEPEEWLEPLPVAPPVSVSAAEGQASAPGPPVVESAVEAVPVGLPVETPALLEPLGGAAESIAATVTASEFASAAVTSPVVPALEPAHQPPIEDALVSDLLSFSPPSSPGAVVEEPPVVAEDVPLSFAKGPASERIEEYIEDYLEECLLEEEFLEAGAVSPVFPAPLDTEAPETPEQGLFHFGPEEDLSQGVLPEKWPEEAQQPDEKDGIPLQVQEVAPETSMPFSSAPGTTPSAFSPAMPVVDLSTTVLEEAPGFLSLEQLSELLNAPEPVVNAIHQHIEDPLDYPDADEGAVPEEMGDASNFPHPAPPARSDEMAQVSVAAPAPVISGTAPPAFPEPDAYAPDEFDFDLNLDQKVEQFGEPVLPVQSPVSGSNLGARIAQSLDPFEESPTPVAAGPSRSAVDAPAHPQAPVAELANVLSEAMPMPMPMAPSANQQALQENLDLLYPPVTQAEAQAPEAPGSVDERSLEANKANGAEGELPALPVAPREIAPAAEMPPVAARMVTSSGSESRPFQVGDKVRHAQYGLGIVQKVIPVEQSTILNITFEAVGKRLLDPVLTRLTLETAVS